jgi:hypothetical protein
MIILKSRKILIFFGIAVLAFIVLLIIFLIFKSFSQKPPVISKPPSISGNKKPDVPNAINYPFDTKKFDQGIKVGNVKITLQDLEYQNNLKNTNVQNNNELNSWKQSAEELSKTVILQNEGKKLGLYELSPEEKVDYNKSNTTKDYVEKNLINNISFEMIRIYIHNILDKDIINPKIGIEKAKQISYETLSNLRKRFIAKDLTFAQAALEIRNNRSLENVDIAWKANSYAKYDNVSIDNHIINQELFDKLWTLKKDQISDVLLSKDGDIEQYYAVFRVNNIVKGGYNTFDNYLENIEKQYSNISL